MRTIQYGSEHWVLHDNGCIERPGLVAPSHAWLVCGAVRYNNFRISDWHFKNGKQRWHIIGDLIMRTVTLPAAWAPAIVNLDYSGLEKQERDDLNTALAEEGLSFSDCLTCSDEYVGRFKGLLCQVADYTFR